MSSTMRPVVYLIILASFLEKHIPANFFKCNLIYLIKFRMARGDPNSSPKLVNIPSNRKENMEF